MQNPLIQPWPGPYGGVPPFQETQNYVQRVTRYWGDLR